jgi:hypothetical protein
MSTRFDESREVGGIDLLDSRLGRQPPVREVARLDVLLRSRAALGLAPAAAPGVIFLPLGMLFGPAGLGVLSPALLAYLTPAVSVGLATLGVFVGLGLGPLRKVDRRLLGASSLEAGLTILVVAAAMWGVLDLFPEVSGASPVFIALAFGIVASASSAGAAEVSNLPAHRAATRVADLDDILPIVGGGVALAWLRDPSPGGALWLTLLSVLIAVLVALAGWLLLDRRSAGPEHVAFFAGLLLLLGGAAEHLSLSALFMGMVAGACWAAAPGGRHEVIRKHLGRIQHPVVVLVLLAAGASARIDTLALWLVIPFVLVRLAGKVAGGWAAARLAAGAPGSLGWFLVAPGVIGVAFALNTEMALPDEAAVLLLTVAVVGSVASEVAAVFLLPHLERRR